MVIEETGIGISVAHLYVQTLCRACIDGQLQPFAVRMSSIMQDISYSRNGEIYLLVTPVNVKKCQFGHQPIAEKIEFGTHFIIPVVFRSISTLVIRTECLVETSCFVAACE